MPTLSLCMISNDGAENMAQCLSSVAGHVDELIVADTGMDDAARAVCAQYGASIYQCDHRSHPGMFFVDSAEECAKFGAPGPFSGQWALGDFGAARNESFKHATKDYIVWIDSDDVLDNAAALRTVVEEIDKRGLGFGFLPYNYASDPVTGKVFYRQWRERIFKRGTAQWHNPVHEVLMPTAPLGMPGRFESPVYQHRRKADRKGIDNRNYKILLRQMWQLKTANPTAPVDPRILFYLGQEARFIDPRRAVGFYEEYLQSSGWPEERAAAHVAIGALLEFGAIPIPPAAAYAQAQREFATAAAEMPDNPDGLFGLARIAYLRERWADCVRYTEQGMKIGNTDSMLGANPQDRLYRPTIYHNYALSKLGRLEEAIASCEAGLAAMPEDPGVPGGAPGMLKLNLGVYKAELEKRMEAEKPKQPDGKPMVTFDKNEDVDAPPVGTIPRDAMVIWSMQLWKQLIAGGDYAKARAFLEALPSTVTADPVIARMFASTNRRASVPLYDGGVGEVVDGRTSVVIWTGPAPEPWTPHTPAEKGLGGSETAAIEMAKNLAALGHSVTVYAECMGTFDGVEYRHHSTFKGANCDVFIASRAPWAVEQFGPVSAKVKLLWVHDIHCGPPSPQMERWLYKFDRVLCLSEWHKGFFLQTYPTLHQDRVIVTRNGIDPARFKDEVPKKKNRLVFSSSPNRGLPYLLHNFQIIRSRVPDAELDIFYGFDTWETMAKARGAQAELDEISGYRKMIADAVAQGGVHFHGKRPQTDVAAAFMEAKVWGYLTDFPETSCISAMEAQAAGCVPVCSRFAALAETVKHGILLDNSQEAPRQFVEEVVRMLKNDVARDTIAQAGRAYALANLSWAALAKEWSEMFISLSRCEDEIPMWRSA